MITLDNMEYDYLITWTLITQENMSFDYFGKHGLLFHTRDNMDFDYLG